MKMRTRSSVTSTTHPEISSTNKEEEGKGLDVQGRSVVSIVRGTSPMVGVKGQKVEKNDQGNTPSVVPERRRISRIRYGGDANGKS